MKQLDIVLDLVKHTAALGLFEAIKVTADDKIQVATTDKQRTVIMSAEMHEKVDGFEGSFGMGNLALLNSLSKLQCYQDEGASMTIAHREINGTNTPVAFKFSGTGGSRDEYGLMSEVMIDQMLKVGKFRGATWDVTLEPTLDRVKELSSIAGIYAGIEPNFMVKLEDGNLIFEVGSNEGGINGRRTFATGVSGNMSHTWAWPLATFLQIVKLGMNGKCTIRFSDMGACSIEVDSGIGVYTYILPASSM